MTEIRDKKGVRVAGNAGMTDPAAILDGVDTDSVPDSSRLAGIVTAGELLAAGLSWPRLRALVRRGVLVPVGWGIYARAAPAAKAARGPMGEQALRVAAALAAVGPAAVAGHHSAALIHGLDLYGRPAAAVAVTRPPGAGGSRTARPGIRLRIAPLPAGQVTVRREIPVTSVARTAVDLARASSFPAGVAVVDSALHRGTVSDAQLHAVLTTCGRWPGIDQARRVVAFSDALSESVLESISRVAFHDQGLPPPVLQAWVGDRGEVIGRADFLWRAHRTIGEADGAVKYADPSRAVAQLRRDARLRQAGFEVVHFTWDEIVHEPHQVAASIRAAFRRRAAA